MLLTIPQATAATGPPEAEDKVSKEALLSWLKNPFLTAGSGWDCSSGPREKRGWSEFRMTVRQTERASSSWHLAQGFWNTCHNQTRLQVAEENPATAPGCKLCLKQLIPWNFRTSRKKCANSSTSKKSWSQSTKSSRRTCWRKRQTCIGNIFEVQSCPGPPKSSNKAFCTKTNDDE